MGAKMQAFALTLLLIVLTRCAFVNPGDPTITSVSITLQTFTAATGSLAGGTTLYIKGTNFSPTSSQNVVTVGPYPCTITAEGSKVDSLACVTSPATDPTQLYNLSSTITVGDVFVRCSTNNCRFSYSQTYTPFIQQIVPRSVLGDSSIYIYGQHKISDLGDQRSAGAGQIEYLTIADHVCSTIDVVQSDDDFDGWSRRAIECKADINQDAGEYDFVQRVDPGFAQLSVRTTQTSYFTGNNYTQRVVPKITELSAHQGGSNGHILTAKGTGFANNVNNYTCKIAGQQCSVIQTSPTQLTIQVPVLDTVNNTQFGSLQVDPIDTTHRTDTFLGGQGATYKRYNRTGIDKSGADWLTYLRGTPSLQLFVSKTTTQLGSSQAYEQNYVQYITGYFHAPLDGTYRFSSIADDTLYMVMSPYANNTNVSNLITLIDHNSYTNSHYNSYIRQNLTSPVSQQLLLASGYYYFELVHTNTGGAGFYKVSVQMPSTHQYTANPTWQVDTLKIAPSVYDAQIITVTVYGASGHFSLFYYQGNTLRIADINIGTSAGNFYWALGYLPIIYSYSPSITLVKVDINGNPTTNSSQVQGYIYTITINKYRPNTTSLNTRITNVVASANKPKSITVTKTSTHSPPLSGTFTFNVNNLPLTIDGTVNLPYSIRTWKIQNALRVYYNLSQIKVSQVLGTSQQNTIQYVIQYVGLRQTALNVTVDLTLLTGGKSGTSPVATISTVRSYSDTIQYYSPIPYDFLHTPSSTSSLQITVNSIPSVCADCSYTFAPTSTLSVSAFSLSGNTYTIIPNNPSSISYQVSDITVSVQGVTCGPVTGNASVFYCTLPLNTDSSVQLPAGQALPKVHIKQMGYLTNVLTPDTIPLTVTSITPSETSPGAGIIATLTGTGFPTSTQNAQSNSVQIQLCGNIVSEYISIQNQQIKVRVPTQVVQCQNNTKITVNNIVQQFIFVYNPALTPTITHLSKSSSSPILKSTIYINGTNFGTSSSQINVYLLLNNTVKYELSVLSVTDNQIYAILGGGRSGEYQLVVQHSTNGRSLQTNQSMFSYLIIVNSLSIQYGHMGGGYLLTVNGLNFATASGSTNVFIGQALNSICSIVNITQNQIKCRVPRKDDTYTVNTSLQVVVTGRVIQESVCFGTCSFYYTQQNTSIVTVPSGINTFRSGDYVSLSGNNLTNATVTVNSVSAAIVNNTDSVITFVYPSVQAGTYQILISVSNGWTYPQFLSTTPLQFFNASIDSGSVYGTQFKVPGNGFPNNINSVSAWLVCSSTSKIPVTKTTPTSITVRVPPMLSDSYCKVNVSVSTSYKLYNMYYRNNNTCVINVTQNANNTFTFNLLNMTSLYTINKAQLILLDSLSNPTTSVYPLTVSNLIGSSSYLPAGTYSMRVLSYTYGYARINNNNNLFVISWPSTPTLTTPNTYSSFVGGREYLIQGAGFITNNINNNQLTVCGLPATVKSATTANITILVPPLVTPLTQSLYSLQSVGRLTGTPFGDSSTAQNINDDSFNTIYTSSGSSTAECFIGYNFGSNTYADVSQIKYVPNPGWNLAASKLQNGIFQGSNDGLTYTQIFSIDTSQVHSGYNTWTPSNPNNTYTYQYVRFRHTNALSQCQLAQLQVYGIKYSTINVTSNTDYSCDIVIKSSSSANTVTLPNAITYQHSSTSVVSSVQPQFGPSTGGDTLHISGSNFGVPIVVSIDGITCNILNSTSTQIYCTTGSRATPPSTGNTFTVISSGNPSRISTQPYLYIDRWSSSNTWGGQAVPRQGDSVYVPKGMTLLVDQSTPILGAVIVQGKIQFQDVQDLTFDAHQFIINGGEFQAGLQTNRHLHKLTITLHGGYYDKQLPIFGNKVLGCRNCKFNMHGKQLTKTWEELNMIIQPGDVFLQLVNAVDWAVGDQIVVASSTFDHYQSEQRTIVSISAYNITVDKPFKYRHFSGTQTYAGVDFVMRAEVGLLTRNIVVRGDDSSVNTEYGSHLMFNGKQANGLVGKVSYAEFTQCGQPKIVGRYCTHFHMAGEVPDSYIRGISVHHSYARVLTIHGTHFLLVQKSVGYHVKGHNIFIQDGIQTNNVIQDNLMISSIGSNIMLQSDITVASYWITNPSNTVRRNHAAGGDFYGFWYEIKQNPDGPSATSDICPMGMKLGQSRDNVAHSNRRFGLRIFKLSARKYPCLDTQNQLQLDPYTTNVPIHSQFDNYLLWRNQECGFLGEQLGYTTINNFKTIDSRKGGLQFHKTNFTKQLVIAQNSVVVGYSTNNAPDDIDSTYHNARGVIAARTDGLKFSGINFVNFGPTMTPLQSCSECWNVKLWVTGSKTTLFQNITYTNIQGSYIYWEKWRRQTFIDLDGSLTEPFRAVVAPSIGQQTKASISPNRPSLHIPNHCFTVTNTTDLWDDSVYCDSTVTLRGILFTNGIPHINFFAIDIKVNLLQAYDQNISALTDSSFSSEPMIIIKKSNDKKNSWAMPFAVNNYYNVHWKWGIDFMHMAIAPSRLWTDTEGVVLRFNYSDHRQLFQIGKWYKSQLQLPFIEPQNSVILPTTCENGDYFHNSDDKYLYVCVSGRNKTIREWIDMNGIRCINFCPTENQQGQRQNFSRLWSNVTQWPQQRLPLLNQNVTIPYEWNLILDVDPPIFNFVKINGILIFDRTRNNTFQAHYIWVKQGIIRIGSQDSPFPNLANIILHGGKNDDYLVIDPDASGNKLLAVTGGLQMYGKVPESVWTRLTETATINSTTLKVVSASGWAIGDTILIAPSYAGRKQYEQRTITNINGNTITINQGLTYQHYGANSVTSSNSINTLDARSAVSVLTRNIKISAGPDAVNNWGATVLIYGYNQLSQDLTIPPVWRNGYAKLVGVQFQKCSQYDSEYAGLRFQNLGINTDSPNTQVSVVKGSSIHHCGGFCMYLKQIQNVQIDNNVIYSARKFLVYVEEVISQYNFTNNLLVGAKKRDEITYLDQTHLVDDVAAYEHYFPISFELDHKVIVTGNLVQGSQGQGFVFPLTPCAYLDTYPFVNNTAGSCEVAFMYERLENQQCLSAKGAIGYASEIGLMANPQGPHQKLIYTDMFFADNERGITLRYAHEIDDNVCILKNSYFAGYSRPNCTTCYSDDKIKYCQGGYAVRMFTATITGEKFPLGKLPTVHDIICTQQAFDFKAFIDNVIFENYLHSNPSLPYCSNMSVFRRHVGASDGTASHHLTNTVCQNCQTKAWAYFEKPNVGWRGWFGGCGELDCTGPNNYIIYDQDGTFTGEKSQLLANNTPIGNAQTSCEAYPDMNGHWCHTQDLAVLEYESIAADFNKRKMWPVYLKYDGGAWNSTTNGWKEWMWDGPEPMNLRLARFWSTIRLHQRYNMTFSSQPPVDMRLQIQRRLLPWGNNSDWAIVRIYYPLPNSIQVLVKNTTHQDAIVKPYPVQRGIWTDLGTKTDICGANNFYYENGTIQFVVNGVNNCQVRVRLSSFIQLSARISIPIADFYTNNGPTSFITNICAFLGIDTGRMKIVSIRQGSTVVTAVIQTTPINSNVSTTTTRDAAAEYQHLNNLAARLGSSSDVSNALNMPLVSLSSNTYIFNDDGTVYTPSTNTQKLVDNKILIIVLSAILPVIAIVVIVGGYCYWKRRRAQIFDIQLNNKSSVQRENAPVSTQFEISGTDDFASSKYNNKKWEN